MRQRRLVLDSGLAECELDPRDEPGHHLRQLPFAARVTLEALELPIPPFEVPRPDAVLFRELAVGRA
jgi:hypothetical protein